MNSSPQIQNRRTIREKNHAKINNYYLLISEKYRLAKMGTLILLIIFLLGMISIYRDEITVENFQYLMKYLNADAPEYTGKYRTIYFDSASEVQLDTYKGELAAVSSSRVSLYNMLGNSTLTYNISAARPVLLTSGQYMLVYAMGENYFSVNNAFSQLYTENTEFPISGAALSDSGIFAVVTKTVEYRGAVYFYDKNFNMISKILKDKLILGCAVNAEGNKAVIISSVSYDGEFRTEIMTLNPYKNEADSVITINDTLGVKVGFNSDGGYTIVCDDRILFFDKNDNKLAEHSYNGLAPINYFLGSDRTTLVFNVNVIGNDNTVTVFDNSGASIYTGDIKGQITDVCASHDYVYILSGSSVLQIKLPNETTPAVQKTAHIESGCKRLIYKDSITLMLCYSHKAEAAAINDLFPDKTEPPTQPMIPDTTDTAKDETAAVTNPTE